MGIILTVPFDGIEFNDYTAEVDGRLNGLESSTSSGNIVIGKIISGMIYSSLGDNNADNALDTVNVNIRPYTTIDIRLNSSSEKITLVDEIIPLNFATYGDNTYIYMYCDFSGKVGFTSKASTEIPENVILLAHSNGYYGLFTGQNGLYFDLHPYISTNHFFYGNTPQNVDINSKIVFSNFGDTIDGINDNTLTFEKLDYLSKDIKAKTGDNVNINLQQGKYIFSGADKQYWNSRYVGAGKGLTILTHIGAGTSILDVHIPYMKNLTVEDLWIREYIEQELFYIKDCKIICNVEDLDFYMMTTMAQNTFIIDNEFVFDVGIYQCLYLTNYKNLLIDGNTLNGSELGDAWHNIKIVPSIYKNAKIIARANTIFGGTTGIFMGANRDMPFVGAIIEQNKLRRQKEESISMDGVGNNPTLCPVIGNGEILAVSNDADGFLVITSSLKYTTSAIVADELADPPTYTLFADLPTYSISERDDWTNFYYSFDDGSGKEGTVVPIRSFDATNNTLTLETYALASSVIIGGMCGVQGGFFNCIVRDNDIVGSVGAGNKYATAISLYLNVFGTLVSNNTVTGCAVGLNVIGGTMMNAYRTRAYNNHSINDKFYDCDQVVGGTGVISFSSYSDIDKNVIRQFGNKLINPTILGGTVINMQQQANFVFENGENEIPVNYRYCGTTLPVPSSSNVGKKILEIVDDSSGYPTDMQQKTCKLVAGAYSWV